MLTLPIKKEVVRHDFVGREERGEDVRKSDLFYEKAMKKSDWKDDDLCDPPTEPREGIHILIDELLGKDWYVAMSENDNQVITQAIYQIIYKYVDEPKKKERIWGIIIIVCALINTIMFFIK